MSESEMVIHRKSFMVKIVRSRVVEGIVDAQIPKLVVDAAEAAIEKLKLQTEYLVLIVVPGDHVTGLSFEEMGEEEEDEDEEPHMIEGEPEHSIYMNGLDTIIIAGVVPGNVEREKWLRSVKRSLIQDFILHWAYTTGSYDEPTQDTGKYLEFLVSERIKEFENI